MKMKRMDFTCKRLGTGWIFLLMLLTTQLVMAQTAGLISLELKNEPLPDVLKRIEKAGGKSILFAYNEVESHRITASVRQKTEREAIEIVLRDTPFSCAERNNYFVIQKKGEKSVSYIHGTVLKEDEFPLAYANVLALHSSDSSFVCGCVTAEDGAFLLPVTTGETLLLKVTYIGYRTEILPCSEKSIVRMKPDQTLLKEVTVIASRPLVERKNGSFLANVQGTPLSLMGSASDMIGHLPFVTGSNGSFAVIGRGAPEIYINGRKVRDNAELDRLQANEILSAEVITTPGAQYGADVPAVIRIRTIRLRGQGWSGHLNTSYSQGHSARGSEGFGLNYRTGGLDLFARGYLSHGSQYTKANSTKTAEGASHWEIKENTFRPSTPVTYFATEVGFNYEPDDHQSFGIRYTPQTNIGNTGSTSYSETVVTRDGEEHDRFSSVSRSYTGHDVNHSMNGYYNGTFNKWNIDFNADYYSGRENKRQEVANDGVEAATSKNRINNKLYAAKLVITAPLKKGQLFFGTEESFTERHDVFFQSGYSMDADDRIKQTKAAAFVDYQVVFGKFNLSAGMRYEYQKTDYYEAGVYKKEQSPKYNHWIPTIAVGYGSDDWNASLAYKLVKFSPGYGMLSSATTYSNKYEYQSGNPFLVPQLHNFFSINGGWKWVNATVYFDYTLDMYTSYSQLYDDETQPGVLLFTNKSIPRTYSYGAAIYLSPKFACWLPRLSADIGWFDSDARSLGVKENWSEPSFSFRLDNSFILPHGWSVNVDGNISLACKQSYSLKHTVGRVNMQVGKSFLKDKSLNVFMKLQDIFHTDYYPFEIYGNSTRWYQRAYSDNQRVEFRIAWQFNATKSKYKGTGAGQDEKNRL